MRKSSKFAALALSAALAFGIAVPAFAAETAEVSKTLQVNNGSSVTATFNFKADAVELTMSNGVKTYTDGPAVSIESIPLTAENAAETGTGAIKFGGETDASKFTHAGIYAWTVSETAGPAQIDGIGEMQYDDTVYTMVAVVQEGEDGKLEIGQIEFVKGAATGINVDGTTGTVTPGVKAEPEFTNKYTETTDEQKTPTDLVITKKVAGAQGDKTKKFEFTVTFTAADGLVLPAGKTAADVLGAIEASGATVTWNAAHNEAKFELADSEKVTFSKILAGITYSIDEKEETGYEQSYAAVANGGAESSEQNNLLIGEKTNTGTMTNKFQDITITGLFLNNAPFILMGAVAVAGVVLYGAAKRKLVA